MNRWIILIALAGAALLTLWFAMIWQNVVRDRLADRRLPAAA
jgi:hypothetical protein